MYVCYMYQNGTTQYFKTKFFVYLGLFLILSFKFSYIILEMIFFVMSKDTLPIFIYLTTRLINYQ